MIAVVDSDLDEREDETVDRDDYELQITEAAEAYTSVFQGDVKELSRSYIEKFFSEREMHCGGTIPNYLLYSDYNISLVLNTNIENGVKLAYYALEKAEHFPPCIDSGIVPDDVKLVTAILSASAKAGIPKEFAAGIMLLYLQYCVGIVF